MEKPKIVIIDSGVEASHPALKGDKFHEIVFEGDNIGGNSQSEIYGHGTAIYGIIRKVKEFFEIINIRICGIENGVDEETLYEALLYIEQHINAAIINLSLGVAVVQNRLRMKEICDRLEKRGSIIVSAFDNTGVFSYPAAFDSVIGVITGTYCRNIGEVEYIEDSIVNVAGKGDFQRVLWSNPQFLIMGGNSFACANVTVRIAELMLAGYTKKTEILQQLKLNAIKVHKIGTDGTAEKLPYSIQKAALFPFNKEMHSLVKYQELLAFDIVSVYDSKYSARVGTTTSFLLKDDKVKSLVIKNISEIQWDEIDTIILGHMETLLNTVHGGSLIDKLLCEAVSRNKRIYMFDDYSNDMLVSYDKVFVPKITEEHLPCNRFGMLYRISKPILAVCGTSSRQGKFTLQLALRKMLLEKGYRIGQIGTEPSALLYGMDYVFPIGYHSSVYIKEYDTIRYLNNAIYHLCEDNNDLIIVGTQSGTVPYDMGNLAQYNISQHLFLLGTQPDAVILCVNPFDEPDYIERTISYIEAAVNSKVISIMVFPMDMKDDWAGIYGQRIALSEERWYLIKEQLSKRLSIPVYRLGAESDLNKIVENVIDFFADGED